LQIIILQNLISQYWKQFYNVNVIVIIIINTSFITNININEYPGMPNYSVYGIVRLSAWNIFTFFRTVSNSTYNEIVSQFKRLENIPEIRKLFENNSSKRIPQKLLVFFYNTDTIKCIKIFYQSKILLNLITQVSL